MRHKLVQRIVEAYDVHSRRRCATCKRRSRAARSGPQRLSAAMIEVEVLRRGARARRRPPPDEVRRLCALAAAPQGHRGGARGGRVRRRRADRRAQRASTGASRARPTCCRSRSTVSSRHPRRRWRRRTRNPCAVPRELGDVIICPGAHGRPARGDRARDAASAGHGPRDRRRRDAGSCSAELLAGAGRVTRMRLRCAGRQAKRRQVHARQRRVGEKVAIVSDRPQTTAERSAACTERRLPDRAGGPAGRAAPRDALTARMARRVQQELDGADAALLMLSGEQGLGPGDRFIARRSASAEPLVTIAVNKVDRLARAALMAVLRRGRRAGRSQAEVFPISARTGAGRRRAGGAPRGADARGAVHVRARARSAISRASCCSLS